MSNVTGAKVWWRDYSLARGIPSFKTTQSQISTQSKGLQHHDIHSSQKKRKHVMPRTYHEQRGINFTEWTFGQMAGFREFCDCQFRQRRARRGMVWASFCREYNLLAASGVTSIVNKPSDPEQHIFFNNIYTYRKGCINITRDNYRKHNHDWSREGSFSGRWA